MAQPGPLVRKGNRLERVVIGQDLSEWRHLPGQLEGVEDVRETVTGGDRGSIGYLEMQVGSSRGARAAHLGYHLPLPNPITGLHHHAARLQMGIDGKMSVAEIEHDAVAA